MTLAQALLLIPPGFHLRCGCEINPETGSMFGGAVLYAESPEDGWPDPRHPADKFLDRPTVSITTEETDFESFESLLVHMLVQQYGTDRQKKAVSAAIDQRAKDRRAMQTSPQVAKEAW